MAKHFDLTDVLLCEKPTIKIGEHVFSVNDEKTNVILMNSALAKKESGIESAELAIKYLLGDEASKKIDALSLSVTAYLELFYALVACVNNEEIKVVKERFQK